jgi:hypothetical protein
MKAAAIAQSSFKEVLFLDADNSTVQDPTGLFDLPEYQKSGAIFWPDVTPPDCKNPWWRIFGVPCPDEPGIEGGQMMINKEICRAPLALAGGMNFPEELYRSPVAGGKGLFQPAWLKLGKAYSRPAFPPQVLVVPDAQGNMKDAVICQHDFTGERIFQHRMFCKWDLRGENPWVSGCLHESKHHELLEELRGLWSGRCGSRRPAIESARLRSVKQELVRHRWLLNVAVPAGRRRKETAGSHHAGKPRHEPLPAFVRLPQDVGVINFKEPGHRRLRSAGSAFQPQETMKELKFSSGGAVGKGGSAATGYFWDIKETAGKIRLELASDEGVVLTLRRVGEHCWQGGGAKLRTVEHAYPQSGRLPAGHLLSPRVRRKIALSLGRQINVVCSESNPDDAVSDHVLAACACTALSRLGLNVTFHSPHADWLSRIDEPGLTVTRTQPENAIDLNQHHLAQLRYGASRASWYAAALHPFLRPEKPVIRKSGTVPRFPFKNYVLLAPYLCAKNRCWPESHWTRLGYLLRGMGCEIVAIGRPEHAVRLQRTFSQTQVFWTVGAYPPDWIMDSLQGAVAYVGLDSDLTHVAAMLNVKSIAIHSQLPPSFLWPDSTVRSVTPATACVFCRWQGDRGYTSACDSDCSALATINPETVATALMEMCAGSGTKV